MKLSGKRDLILAAAILLIAAALFGFNYISHKKPAVTAQITVDGKAVSGAGSYTGDIVVKP